MYMLLIQKVPGEDLRSEACSPYSEAVLSNVRRHRPHATVIKTCELYAGSRVDDPTSVMYLHSLVLLSAIVGSVLSQNILLTNDDGWAVAQIHAQNDALKAAGFNVSISRGSLHFSMCCLLTLS